MREPHFCLERHHGSKNCIDLKKKRMLLEKRMIYGAILQVEQPKMNLCLSHLEYQ